MSEVRNSSRFSPIEKIAAGREQLLMAMRAASTFERQWHISLADRLLAAAERDLHKQRA